MSTTTQNLGLFKYDVIEDANAAFNINTALNDNWDKIDTTMPLKLDKTGGTVNWLNVSGTLQKTEDSNPAIYIKNTSLEYNKAPSTSTGLGRYIILDKNNQWVGMFQAERYADNHTVVVMQGHSQTGVNCRLELCSDSNGNWYTKCPSSAEIGSIVTTTSISKATNGYVTFGNGIIIQWGSNTLVNQYRTITLPKSFSTSDYAFVIADYGETLAVSNIKVLSKTTTTTNLYSTTSSNSDFMGWIAIGF